MYVRISLNVILVYSRPKATNVGITTMLSRANDIPYLFVRHPYEICVDASDFGKRDTTWPMRGQRTVYHRAAHGRAKLHWCKQCTKSYNSRRREHELKCKLRT